MPVARPDCKVKLTCVGDGGVGKVRWHAWRSSTSLSREVDGRNFADVPLDRVLAEEVSYCELGFHFQARLGRSRNTDHRRPLFAGLRPDRVRELVSKMMPEVISVSASMLTTTEQRSQQAVRRQDNRVCAVGYRRTGRIRSITTSVVPRDRRAAHLFRGRLSGQPGKCRGQGMSPDGQTSLPSLPEPKPALTVSLTVAP